MIVVDASVLIGFLEATDTHHLAATEVVSDAEPPLIVHPLTLAESLVGAVRVGRGEQAWAILKAVGVVVDDTPLEAMALASLRATTGIKLPDCCVLLSAANHHCGFVSFDARLNSQH